MDQARDEINALQHAADLAAVRGRYFSAQDGVEGELQRTEAVRTPEAAAPFVSKLHHAIAAGTLNAGWLHPTYRWNHMHVAAAAGDAALARALIDCGVEPNRPDKTGMTPLHVAAASGSAELVALFLEHHARPDAPGPNGYRPLQFAARSGSRTCVEALVRAGADVDAQDPRFRMTALHFAAAEGKLEAVRGLIAAGANPLLTERGGTTALDTLKDSKAARQARDYKQVRDALKMAGEIARNSVAASSNLPS